MMDAKLKIAMMALRKITKVPRAEFDMTTVAKIAQTAFFDIDAIAPLVDAGSVDTMQRYDLTMSWGETVMEDCTSGDWVRHDDAIAWNAQECERAKNASSNCIKINEELMQEQRRAEKAELLLSSVAALAHKWNKDAVKDGFAASEAGLDLLELMGWPKV